MGRQDLKIHELVAKIERGDIRLPEMQRQYVWHQTRVRDLLDSLYRGYLPGIVAKLGASALETQAIPTSTDLWSVGKYEDFLRRRRELVAARLNSYLGHRQAEVSA